MNRVFFSPFGEKEILIERSLERDGIEGETPV